MGGRKPEDHEHRFTRFEVQRHGGAAVFNRVRRRLDVPRVRMPKLGFLAGDAEAGADLLRAVPAIGDEIDVGVTGAAVNPDDAGIERAGEFGVLGQVERGLDGFGRQRAGQGIDKLRVRLGND